MVIVAVPSPQDPTQTLEERVEALELVAQAQAERIAELEALFVQLGDGLAAGTQRLDLALAASRLNGFEWNQNPQSHTDVIEGLRAEGMTMTSLMLTWGGRVMQKRTVSATSSGCRGGKFR